MGSSDSDSLSLPSEPQDIGNWFSSYVYESPELNTFEDIRDPTGSVIAEKVDSLNESKQNLDGITILARINSLPRDDDTCLGDELKYSDSFSLGSEPIDVKKWFSSYMYESPVLDSNWDFTSNEKKSDSRCRNTEQEVILNNSTRNVKDFDSENENPNIPECQGVNDALLSIKTDSHEKRRKSKPFHPKLDTKKESSRTEDDSIKVSEENTETIINREDAKTGKNNNNPEISESGFISTRKIRSKRGENDENSLKRLCHVGLADLSNNKKKRRIHESEEEEEDEEIIVGKRKVLSERTNIQTCNVVSEEVRGKWKCPQKSKPNLGPPFKQLRLEQWLRRV